MDGVIIIIFFIYLRVCYFVVNNVLIKLKILFRHWSKSLRSHVRYAREPGEFIARDPSERSHRKESEMENEEPTATSSASQHSETTANVLQDMMKTLTESVGQVAQTMASMNVTLADIKENQNHGASSRRGTKRPHDTSNSSTTKRVCLESSSDSENENGLEPNARALLNKTASRGESPDAGKGAPEKSEKHEDDLLNEIATEFNSDEQTSDAVSSQLADVINKRWSSKLDDEKLDIKLKKYNRPSNCDKIVAPKVNPEIWAQMNNFTKKKDLRMSKIQQMLAKVGAALSKSTQLILDMRNEPPTSEEQFDDMTDSMLSTQMDAIAILGHASYEMSLRRRDLIQPSLNKDYTSLSSQQIPVTSLLYGEDLQTSLTAIRSSNKLGKSVKAPQSKPAQDRMHWRAKQDNERSFLDKRKGRNSKPPWQPWNGFNRRKELTKQKKY